MAIRVKCYGCDKQISVDDAFAGGLCRCPYCKTMVMVQADESTETSARPTAPNERPAAPGERPAETPTYARTNARISLANPVKTQVILMMVLAGIILAMVIGGIVIALYMMNRDGVGATSTTQSQRATDDNADSPRAPDATLDKKGIVATAPVVYCIDTGSSMAQMYDYARGMMRLSIRSMKTEQKFGIVLCMEGVSGDEASWVKIVTAQLRGGGKAGEDAIKDDISNISPAGASDVAQGLKAAIALKPQTIVLFARKNVDSALPVAKLARSSGITIITVALDVEDDINRSLSDLAEASGGSSYTYSFGQLQAWLTDVDMD